MSVLARTLTYVAGLRLDPRARAHEHGQRLLAARTIYVTLRGPTLRVWLDPGPVREPLELAGDEELRVRNSLAQGKIQQVEIIGSTGSAPSPWLLEILNGSPVMGARWLFGLVARSENGASGEPPTNDGAEADPWSISLDLLERTTENIDLLDLICRGIIKRRGGEAALPEPFAEDVNVPPVVSARPRSRSTLFIHNSYYHFNELSAGLVKRGWDATTVAIEAPDSSQQQLYHGQDISLYHPDPVEMRRKTREFFSRIPERFEAVHFYGLPSLFLDNVFEYANPSRLPWDFLELRRHRVLIGFMPSGCLDGGVQSSIRELSDNVCGRCVWELRPSVCNESKTTVWNRYLRALCDWVGLECDYGTPERVTRNTVYGPVVTALDPDRWRPDLAVPDSRTIERQPGEILVYHGVVNYELRRAEGRDIKGTGAVFAAIERLKDEGHPVRLVFASEIPSTEVRYVQVQADIVLDQLNYGRYGATAREAMMLGKPTICRMNPRQADGLGPLRPIVEAPIASATEDTVYEVLRRLAVDPQARAEQGRRARDFAIAWHGRDACAARYEAVIDRLHRGLPADDVSLYPAASALSATNTEGHVR
jgi:hypothetical protein